MKVTIFTSNQPRHIALINRLANAAEVVYAVQEVTTVHPGAVSDFYGNSETMHKYFNNVRSAENIFFQISDLHRTQSRHLHVNRVI